jgi:predicted protein tyrosine phosphatase
LEGYVDTLRLAFHDYDPARMHSEHFSEGWEPSYFTREQADELVAFATKHRGRPILVHCAAGISRSGAVVEALLQAFPEYEDRGGFRHPNTHVLVLLKRAFGLVPSGADRDS